METVTVYGNGNCLLRR